MVTGDAKVAFNKVLESITLVVKSTPFSDSCRTSSAARLLASRSTSSQRCFRVERARVPLMWQYYMKWLQISSSFNFPFMRKLRPVLDTKTNRFWLNFSNRFHPDRPGIVDRRHNAIRTFTQQRPIQTNHDRRTCGINTAIFGSLTFRCAMTLMKL